MNENLDTQPNTDNQSEEEMSLNEINDFFQRELRDFAEGINQDIMQDRSTLDLINPTEEGSTDRIEALFDDYILRLKTIRSIALERNKRARSGMGLEE